MQSVCNSATATLLSPLNSRDVAGVCNKGQYLCTCRQQLVTTCIVEVGKCGSTWAAWQGHIQNPAHSSLLPRARDENAFICCFPARAREGTFSAWKQEEARICWHKQGGLQQGRRALCTHTQVQGGESRRQMQLVCTAHYEHGQYLVPSSPNSGNDVLLYFRFYSDMTCARPSRKGPEDGRECG